MILKLTQKNPDKRYSGATSLIKDISYLQDGKKVHRYSYDEESDYCTKKVPTLKHDNFYQNAISKNQDDIEFDFEKKSRKKPSIVTLLAIITAIGLLGIVFSMRGFLFQSSKNTGKRSFFFAAQNFEALFFGFIVFDFAFKFVYTRFVL